MRFRQDSNLRGKIPKESIALTTRPRQLYTGSSIFEEIAGNHYGCATLKFAIHKKTCINSVFTANNALLKSGRWKTTYICSRTLSVLVFHVVFLSKCIHCFQNLLQYQLTVVQKIDIMVSIRKQNKFVILN